MKELDKITVYGDGTTYPTVPSGTDIILIQNENVQVGKLNIGEQYDFYMEIDHPKNKKELDKIAIQLISDIKPEYLNSEESIIALCPKSISEKMVWD